MALQYMSRGCQNQVLTASLTYKFLNIADSSFFHHGSEDPGKTSREIAGKSLEEGRTCTFQSSTGNYYP